MYSEVGICRIALGLLGANSILSLDEDTTEAALCRENYPFCRDAVLEEADWTFALREDAINRVTSTTPLLESGSYYQLPDDFIRARRVYLSPGQKAHVWERYQDKIFIPRHSADVAYLSYIFRNEDPVQYSANFVQALAARLAAVLAIPVTNSKTVLDAMWTLYGQAIRNARTQDGLQGGNQPLPESQLIKARYRG